MSKIDHGPHSTAPADDEPPRGLWHRVVRRYRAVQDRTWQADEKWAADRGHDTWRSPSGWTVHVRDPRFDYRHECTDCDGVGRHPITGDECPDCDGTGVVTEIPPEDGEPR